MANVSRPNGFRPVRSLADGWDGMIETFAVLAADATALFVGDVVKLSGAADVNGLAAITRVTANTDAVLGVVVGFTSDYTNLNLPSQYRVASTDRYALVIADRNCVFEVQASGAYGVATDAGLNCGMTFTAGSANTGLSGMQLDLATKATTVTLPFKILGLKQSVENDVSDTSNLKVLVVLNQSVLQGNVVGI